jgi:hypothetical protein
MSRIAVLSAALCALAIALTPPPAHAIPPFARKYRISCATCHVAIPKLNELGETFASNGFEFAIGEIPRDTISTGDPLLRLQNSFPLGVRLDAYQRLLSRRAAGEAMVDQQVPWTVKLLSGGQVADKVSYYLYFLASERGEVGGLEDAYIQFTDIRGTGVSVLAGQFQVSDPLLKRELRLSYEDYQAYRVRVGDTRADLTYDRGLMAVWSGEKGTDVAVEIVSGQGLQQATNARQYDRDTHQSYVARISQGVGPIRLGVFGYTGRESALGVTSRIRVFGPDATVPIGSIGELNFQFLRRWDSDPFLGACTPTNPCPGGHTEPFATTVDAALGEVVLWPQGHAGRWFVNAVINVVEADDPVISLRLGEQDDAPGFIQRYRTGSFGVHYLLRRNLRLMTEMMWDAEAERARLVTGFTVGF